MKALTNNEGQSRAPGSISKALPPQVAPRSRGQPHTQEIKMKRSMKRHRGSWGHSRACLPFTDPRDPCLVAFSGSVNKDQNPQKKSSSLLRGKLTSLSNSNTHQEGTDGLLSCLPCLPREGLWPFTQYKLFSGMLDHIKGILTQRLPIRCPGYFIGSFSSESWGSAEAVQVTRQRCPFALELCLPL